MSLIKKYHNYKRAFQTLIFLNMFIIVTGLYFIFDHFKNQTPTPNTIVTISLLTLVFGVGIPWYLFHEMAKTMRNLRKQTETVVAKLVANWMDAHKHHGEDALKDPHFWLNLSLLGIETLGEHSHHPVIQIASEFSPIMRHELHKHTKKSKRAA